MTWDYLQNPVLQVRQRIAAHFLRDCDRILEIGAFKTPISNFLNHHPREVLMIDPLAEPFESNELNGWPSRVRYLPIGLNALDIRDWCSAPFGLLFCGMDLSSDRVEPKEWLDTVCRFVYLVSRANPPVLEYPVQWHSSARLFNAILSMLQPRIVADIQLDLTRYLPPGVENDAVRSRFDRRVVVLTDMEHVENLRDLRQPIARILFGSQLGPYIAETADVNFAEAAGALDLRSATLGCEKAHIRLQGEELLVATATAPWSYAALLPFSPAVSSSLSRTAATPAKIEIEITVEAGEVGLGIVHEDMRQITGERLIRASDGPQNVCVFVRDLRQHVGVMCRNGSLPNTAGKARIRKASLSLPK